MAGGLADHHLLDELAHDVDEGLLRLGIGVFAHVIEGGVDDQFDGFWTDFRLQFLDLLPEILLRCCLLQADLEPGPALLELIEHVVERCQTRAAFGGTIANLLDDLALFLFGSFQLSENTLALVGFVLGGRCEVTARLSSDVVEHAHAEECGGEAGQNSILQILAQDLLVRAAGAVEAIDRQLVLVVEAAIAFFGHDGVGSATFGAFRNEKSLRQRFLSGSILMCG
ncbi:hypothetical protein [Neorhizobium alkalisoli]|uniref:hypothetical protein n=1 Tax=Neorhizobium alkalisoli TaxID=528178 RepID=UPI001475B070|nr:hypothetical protein [Neorhizobium alkalisoli]